MSGSDVGNIIILLDTVLAPLSMFLCFFLLWSISNKLQVVIEILRKMEKIKLKLLDE